MRGCRPCTSPTTTPTGYHVEVGAPLTTDSFAVTDHERGRPFKSVRVLFDATITGGELGTTEVDGSTDFARWMPLTEVDGMGYRADIVDVALGLIERPSDVPSDGSLAE